MRRYLILAAILVAAGVAMALGRSLHGRDDDVGPTARVERTGIERIVVASGTIEPEQLVELRPKVSGIVQRFLVGAGDRVTAGQVVAEIDRETLEASVREARAVVREAEVARDQANVDLRRMEQLCTRGVESPEARDRTRAAQASAEARLARAQATLERIEQELSYATITAPIDGVVLRRDLDPGAAVASVAAVTGGTVLMKIADISRLHLLGTVDENEIAQVRIGQEARIRTEAYPGEPFPGRVRKIASIGDRKENVTTFEVEVEVLAGGDRLWPRMSGDADIVAEVRGAALTLPEAALRYEGDAVFADRVARGAGQHSDAQRLRTGIQNGDRIEVVDGLAEGDEVVLH